MLKKIAFAITALLFVAGLHAQKSERTFNPEERAQKQVERLDARLNLTPAAENSLKTTFADYYREKQQMHAAKANTAEKKSEKDKAAYKQMRENLDKRVQQVLTAEQFAEYQKMQAEHKGRGHHGKGKKDGKKVQKS